MNRRLKDEHFVGRRFKEVVSEGESVRIRLTGRVIVNCQIGLLHLLLCLKIRPRLIGEK